MNTNLSVFSFYRVNPRSFTRVGPPLNGSCRDLPSHICGTVAGPGRQALLSAKSRFCSPNWKRARSKQEQDLPLVFRDTNVKTGQTRATEVPANPGAFLSRDTTLRGLCALMSHNCRRFLPKTTSGLSHPRDRDEGHDVTQSDSRSTISVLALIITLRSF